MTIRMCDLEDLSALEDIEELASISNWLSEDLQNVVDQVIPDHLMMWWLLLNNYGDTVLTLFPDADDKFVKRYWKLLKLSLGIKMKQYVDKIIEQVEPWLDFVIEANSIDDFFQFDESIMGKNDTYVKLPTYEGVLEKYWEIDDYIVETMYSFFDTDWESRYNVSLNSINKNSLLYDFPDDYDLSAFIGIESNPDLKLALLIKYCHIKELSAIYTKKKDETNSFLCFSKNGSLN